MTVAYVYCWFNTMNGKIYVGKSINPSRRRLIHLTVAKSGVVHHLYNAMRLYKNAFEFRIISEHVSEEEAFQAEAYWESFFRSTEREFGYNLRRGGEGGNSLNNEVKQRISATLSKIRKGNANPFYKKHHSDEFRIKQSNRFKGEVRSGAQNPFHGKKHTSEQKALWSQQRSLEKHPRSKMTSQKADDIRIKFDEGIDKDTLAIEYNVSRLLIHRIVTRSKYTRW